MSNETVVGAALLHRHSDGDAVGEAFRAAAEIRWLIVQPDGVDVGRRLLDASLDLILAWSPSHIFADGSLPAPGCYGVPDSWPHIRHLLVGAGFAGPLRTELVLAARCEDLTGVHLDDAVVTRSVGARGARLDLIRSGQSSSK